MSNWRNYTESTYLKGFVVLGFPSRNFLYQEFDEESQVEEFCKSQFDVTFPLFSITNVTAANTHPFFENFSKKPKKDPDGIFINT